MTRPTKERIEEIRDMPPPYSVAEVAELFATIDALTAERDEYRTLHKDALCLQDFANLMRERDALAERVKALRELVMRKEFRQELRKQADAESKPLPVVEQEAKAWAKHRRFNGPGSAMSWDQKDVEDAFVAGAQHGKSMQL